MKITSSRSQSRDDSGGKKRSSDIVVFITAPSEKEANKIARVLVESGLAACANIISPIKSIYTWDEKITEDTETFMIFKTKLHLFEDLSLSVKKIHSYEVPEIIALPIIAGAKDYLKWMSKNTRKHLK